MGVLKKSIQVESYLKVFFDIYFKHDTLYITDDSAMWDLLKYVGGNSKPSAGADSKQLANIDVIFDETTSYMLDSKWQVYISSALKHLFWHKMYIYIDQYIIQGMSKVKAIQAFCERFELDGEELEMEHLRRAMFRWSEQPLVRNEIILGTITANFKETKKLPKELGTANTIQLEIF